MKTALRVIDVQHALCSGAEAAFDIDRVVERINGAIARARAAGVPVVRVVLVQHEEPDGPLRFGSARWQLDDRVAGEPGDACIRKSVPDAFDGTGLQAAWAALGPRLNPTTSSEVSLAA
jgi:nicotinamidase-related amidase